MKAYVYTLDREKIASATEKLRGTKGVETKSPHKYAGFDVTKTTELGDPSKSGVDSTLQISSQIGVNPELQPAEQEWIDGVEKFTDSYWVQNDDGSDEIRFLRNDEPSVDDQGGGSAASKPDTGNKSGGDAPSSNTESTVSNQYAKFNVLASKWKANAQGAGKKVSDAGKKLGSYFQRWSFEDNTERNKYSRIPDSFPRLSSIEQSKETTEPFILSTQKFLLNWKKCAPKVYGLKERALLKFISFYKLKQVYNYTVDEMKDLLIYKNAQIGDFAINNVGANESHVYKAITNGGRTFDMFKINFLDTKADMTRMSVAGSNLTENHEAKVKEVMYKDHSYKERQIIDELVDTGKTNVHYLLLPFTLKTNLLDEPPRAKKEQEDQWKVLESGTSLETGANGKKFMNADLKTALLGAIQSIYASIDTVWLISRKKSIPTPDNNQFRYVQRKKPPWETVLAEERNGTQKLMQEWVDNQKRFLMDNAHLTSEIIDQNGSRATGPANRKRKRQNQIMQIMERAIGAIKVPV